MSVGAIGYMLVIGHYLFDFGLQSKFMADGKNRRKPLPGVPWFHPMIAHCVLHGGAVYFVTGSMTLGLLETAAHFAIDDSKCDERFGWHVDQALHLACKLLWLFLLVQFPGYVP